MYCLLEAVSVYPEKLAAKFVDKTEWIKVYPPFWFCIFYFIFFHVCGMFKFPGRSLNLHHSSDPNHCSSNATSLTSCATGELDPY